MTRLELGDHAGPVIVYLAGVSYDGIEGTDHHMARQLSRRTPVVWVDPPAPLTQILRQRRTGTPARRSGLSRLSDGMWRLHTVVPPGVTRPLLRNAAHHLLYRSLAHHLRSVPTAQRVAVVAQPDIPLARLPVGIRALYLTDDFSAGESLLGTSAQRARHTTMKNAAAADVVLSVSNLLGRRLDHHAQHVLVLPNGCDSSLMERVESAAIPGDVGLARPIAGLVGQLNDRLDLDMLEATAATGASLLLVGPRYDQQRQVGKRLDDLIERANVRWVGRKPPKAVPSYLKIIDVGLTPYVRSEFNDASHPLKTLEYIAAGRRVVSTDLPTARELGTSLVDLARDAEEFAEMVTIRLGTVDNHAIREECRDFANRHDWSIRAQQLLSALAHTAEPAVP